MKTPEEIKKGLECDDCKKCPYSERNSNDGDNHCGEVEADALALIQQLEANASQVKKALQDNGFQTLDELLKAYDQVKQERDAAVFDLTESQYCYACKHREEKEELDAKNDVPAQCVNCAFEVSQFLWRGPCEENGGQKEEEK